MNNASRRLNVLSQHLGEPCGERHVGEVELQPVTGSSNNAGTSYASATGQPSSYARVHGEVSRAPAHWRRIDTVAKEELREVRYEKAVEEGIAKVGRRRAVRNGTLLLSGAFSSPTPALAGHH